MNNCEDFHKNIINTFQKMQVEDEEDAKKGECLDDVVEEVDEAVIASSEVHNHKAPSQPYTQPSTTAIQHHINRSTHNTNHTTPHQPSHYITPITNHINHTSHHTTPVIHHTSNHTSNHTSHHTNHHSNHTPPQQQADRKKGHKGKSSAGVKRKQAKQKGGPQRKVGKKVLQGYDALTTRLLTAVEKLKEVCSLRLNTSKAFFHTRGFFSPLLALARVHSRSLTFIQSLQHPPHTSTLAQGFYVVQLHADTEVLSEIKDPDALVNNELMDGRDSFLSLAREKRLEFSSVRRSKYSTLVLLYELHTQSKDNFVYLCNACKAAVESLYHCEVCTVSVVVGGKVEEG